MKLSKLISAIAFSAVSLGAGVASADYVCNVSFNPFTGGAAGTEGYVLATLWTGANCSGALVASKYFCSSGATFSNCVANASQRKTRDDLHTLFSVLSRAAMEEESVTVLNSTCNGGGNTCASYLQVN
jgi:hypothetical protein